MLSSMGICMYAAIQQVDTSLRAMAACNCIKKEANFNNKATLAMRLGLKHRTTAVGECTQHVRQKEIAVARVAIFQSLAQNAAHATRHAYLGTRHNVWYGTTAPTVYLGHTSISVIVPLVEHRMRELASYD